MPWRLVALAAILTLIAGLAADASGSSQAPSLNWSNIRVRSRCRSWMG